MLRSRRARRLPLCSGRTRAGTLVMDARPVIGEVARGDEGGRARPAGGRPLPQCRAPRSRHGAACWRPIGAGRRSWCSPAASSRTAGCSTACPSCSAPPGCGFSFRSGSLPTTAASPTASWPWRRRRLSGADKHDAAADPRRAGVRRRPQQAVRGAHARARSRRARTSCASASGWGPTARVGSVAREWGALARLMAEQGAETRGEVDPEEIVGARPEALGRAARRQPALSVVPTQGGAARSWAAVMRRLTGVAVRPWTTIETITHASAVQTTVSISSEGSTPATTATAA